MDYFTDMIKDVYKKIDSSNSSFCSTPGINSRKLTNKIARSLLLGKGDLDELLTSVGRDREEKDYRNKKVCTDR